MADWPLVEGCNSPLGRWDKDYTAMSLILT